MNEPTPTNKITIYTKRGNLDIELFGNEAPNAVNTFLSRCKSGFYSNSWFSTITPEWILGGPPCNSMGEQLLPIEQNQRLRFLRRGLVAYEPVPGGNSCRFLITLGPTPELAGRSTLFGRVVGNSIYTAEAIAAGARDGDRPLFPVEIVKTSLDEEASQLSAAPDSKRHKKRQLRIYDDDEPPIRLKRALRAPQSMQTRSQRLISLPAEDKLHSDLVKFCERLSVLDFGSLI